MLPLLYMEQSNYTSGSQKYIVQSNAVVHITWIIQMRRYDIYLTSRVSFYSTFLVQGPWISQSKIRPLGSLRIFWTSVVILDFLAILLIVQNLLLVDMNYPIRILYLLFITRIFPLSKW